MIQDQLVEYILSQIKLGVARDAIKTALVGAGWKAEDVDDTLKKVDGGNAVAPSQPAVAAQPMQISSASFSPSDIVGETKSVQPQAKLNIQPKPITMNDFVSGAGAAQNQPKQSFSAKMDLSAGGGMARSSKSKGDMVAIVIEAVLMIALAGLSGYLYFQNKNLDVKISGLNGQGTGVASQLANLNGQLQTFSNDNANLTAQVASLTAENVDLQTNLSFFVALPASAEGSSVMPAGATTTVMVNGTVSGGGRALYTITTADSVKVLVRNSSDASVTAVFAPLVGTMVQATGYHIPGSPSVTVTAVNGISVQ